MEEHTTSYTTTIKAEFRRSDYTEEDVRKIYTALRSLGSVRSTGLPIPAAGGSAEIWLVIEFIGLNAATGLVQHFGAKFYDKLAEALLALTRHKLKEVPVPPQLETIVISYDDLDIAISLPKRNVIKRLPKIISNIHDHLISTPLSEHTPKYICMPVIYSEGYWRELMGWEIDRSSSRYWGISEDRRIGFTKIYDSRKRKLLEPSHNEIASFLYTEIARLKQIPDHEVIQDYVNRVQGLSTALGIPIEYDGRSIGIIVKNLLTICDQADYLDPQSRLAFINSLLKEYTRTENNRIRETDKLLDNLLSRQDFEK